MKDKLSLDYAFEWIFAALTAIALVAVLETFAIGRHYIIPSGILAVAVIFGNLAWYGFENRAWAKLTLFWLGGLFTAHCFFALFWSKRYRELLGESFEVVCASLVVVFAFLLYRYARGNALFRR